MIIAKVVFTNQTCRREKFSTMHEVKQFFGDILEVTGFVFIEDTTTYFYPASSIDHVEAWEDPIINKQ